MPYKPMTTTQPMIAFLAENSGTVQCSRIRQRKNQRYRNNGTMSKSPVSNMYTLWTPAVSAA